MPSHNTKYRRVYYVLSTHWDREWYRPFQGFRRQLVHLMDRTLEGLSDGFLKGPFSTDGQAIVLEDYLEIRPECQKQIENLVRSEKMKVGPWYVLPDECLVSGESIVRNLRLGRAVARKFGAAPSHAGFVCDLFGHISQLPQIFQGFGIKNALLWRGVEPRKNAHFIWEGADGSRVLCYRFPTNGYCDFGFEVRRLTEPTLPFDQDRATTDLKKWLEKEAARTSVTPLLIFDGGDHMQVDEKCYQLVADSKPGADFPYDIVFATLDDYMSVVETQASSVRDVVRGELREAGYAPGNKDAQWLIPGVLSSRIWIKQANAECQTLLCQWAEPFSSIASSLLQEKYPEGYLDVAWRWLLQNHPHDSICGCSIDEVHEDMKYRFAQCRQIAYEQTNESLNLIAAAVEGDVSDKELRVLVANPMTHPLDEPFTLTLQIPGEWSTYQEFFGFEPKPAFRIFDAQKKEIPYQLIGQDLNRAKHRYVPTKFPVSYRTNDVTVAIRLALPSLGYTTLIVQEGEKTPTGQALPARHLNLPGLATSERSMENEFLAVTVESNGTLTVLDKRTKAVYPRLLTFEDAGDIGDGWFHGPPVNDQIFVSSSSWADVALVSDGKALCCFRARVEMRVPVQFDSDRKIRSENFKTLVIDNWITLRSGCDRLEVRTTVDNQCKDHRLRVLFPTGTNASRFLSDTAFDVVEREIALPSNNHLGRELAVDAAPQQSWTAVAGVRRGLAVVSSGLPEAAVYDRPGRPIALTLFRSTRRTVFTDGQPEGQVQGTMTFHYWIVPQPGKIDRLRLCNDGVRLAAGIKTVQLRAPDVALFRKQSKLPPTASFFEVKGDAITTSVRQADGALEVRLFNPQSKSIRIALFLPSNARHNSKTYRTVTRVNLESTPQSKSKKIGSRLDLSLKAKEIVTLRFE